MINLFHSVNFINDPRIFQILMKGLRNVINLILKIGSNFKTREEIQEYSDYNITNKRKILLKPERRDFSQYKAFFATMRNPTKSEYLFLDKTGKIKLNNRKGGTIGSLRKLSSDDKLIDIPSPDIISPDKTPRNRGESMRSARDDSVKSFREESMRSLATGETDFAWVVMKEKIPSGEAILKLFGKILFETAEINVVTLIRLLIG